MKERFRFFVSFFSIFGFVTLYLVLDGRHCLEVGPNSIHLGIGERGVREHGEIKRPAFGVFAACSLLTFIPFKYWTKAHNYHHGHNGILDENRGVGDIYTLTVKEFHELTRFKKLKYRIFRSTLVLFVLGPLVNAKPFSR